MSKKTKDKKPVPTEVESTLVQPETQDVIKGRLTEEEWKEHLENEKTLEIVSEVVWDVVDVSWETIYHKWVQREIFPYAVEDAKKKLLQAVSWNFLARDEGEGDIENDSSWLPDEEPSPPPVDNWARGMVPVFNDSSHKNESAISFSVESSPSQVVIREAQDIGRPSDIGGTVIITDIQKPFVKISNPVR